MYRGIRLPFLFGSIHRLVVITEKFESCAAGVVTATICASNTNTMNLNTVKVLLLGPAKVIVAYSLPPRYEFQHFTGFRVARVLLLISYLTPKKIRWVNTGPPLAAGYWNSNLITSLPSTKPTIIEMFKYGIAVVMPSKWALVGTKFWNALNELSVPGTRIVGQLWPMERTLSCSSTMSIKRNKLLNLKAFTVAGTVYWN